MKRNYFLLFLVILVLFGCSTITDEKIEELHKQNLPIAISSLWKSKPNSVGGIDVQVGFKNITDKTIKYITFYFQAFNNVDDIVYCTIRGYSDFGGKVTGPILPTKTKLAYWENYWYNHKIKYIKIQKVKIEYMDGAHRLIEKSEVDKIICF